MASRDRVQLPATTRIVHNAAKKKLNEVGGERWCDLYGEASSSPNGKGFINNPVASWLAIGRMESRLIEDTRLKMHLTT
jgi:hypothetical protein